MFQLPPLLVASEPIDVVVLVGVRAHTSPLLQPRTSSAQPCAIPTPPLRTWMPFFLSLTLSHGTAQLHLFKKNPSSQFPRRTPPSTSHPITLPVMEEERAPQEEAAAVYRPAKDFTPRSYQKKAFEVALQENTIVMMEMGARKTIIAVMLIREIGKIMQEKGEKPLMVFLVPTVLLIKQQYEVIRDYTDFEVEEYYGDKGVDEWSAEC